MAKEVLDLGFPGKVLGSSRAVAVIAVGSSRAVGHCRLERERFGGAHARGRATDWSANVVH
jgi:hypothetical protein